MPENTYKPLSKAIQEAVFLKNNHKYSRKTVSISVVREFLINLVGAISKVEYQFQ